MQAQCQRSIYIISNVHKQSFGIGITVHIGEGDRGWGGRVTKSPASRCAALGSGAEIPVQVQTLMGPPPSLAASTVLPQALSRAHCFAGGLAHP